MYEKKCENKCLKQLIITKNTESIRNDITTLASYARHVSRIYQIRRFKIFFLESTVIENSITVLSHI